MEARLLLLLHFIIPFRVMAMREEKVLGQFHLA